MTYDVNKYFNDAKSYREEIKRLKVENAELMEWKKGMKGVEEYYEVKAQRDELLVLNHEMAGHMEGLHFGCNKSDCYTCKLISKCREGKANE